MFTHRRDRRISVMGKPRLEFKLISSRTNHSHCRKLYGSTARTRIGFRQLRLTPIERLGRILVLTDITNPLHFTSNSFTGFAIVSESCSGPSLLPAHPPHRENPSAARYQRPVIHADCIALNAIPNTHVRIALAKVCDAIARPGRIQDGVYLVL